AAPPRSVNTNRATQATARVDAAMMAGDAGALRALLSDDYELLDHTTDARGDRDTAMDTLHVVQKSGNLEFRESILATLGDSVALCRVIVTGSAFAAQQIESGPFEIDGLAVRVVDAHDRLSSSDLFPTNQLGGAIACLYQRYAVHLPDGPE